VIVLCDRKSSILDTGSPGGGRGGPAPDAESVAESRKLTEAMVLNLNKSSELMVKQISTTESSKSSLSRLAPDQATLLKLLKAESFEGEGMRELNEFTAKLTQSRDPMTAINMVRQETAGWRASMSDRSLLQFLSSGYLAPNINQEPDGLTSLGVIPHHKKHRFKDKTSATSDNMRAMFGEKTFDEDTIKRYSKKQLFLPSRIEDWAFQLEGTAKSIDLFTCEYGMASEGYRAAFRLYEENEPAFRAVFMEDKLLGVKILYFLDRVF
jgi:hypothetical protein